MKKILSIGPLAALLLCGCEVTYKNSAMLVVTKVIQATAPSSGSGGCTYSPETLELTFGIFNPLGGGYTHGLVIENRLPDNSGSPGRVNTNDFQIEFAVIDYAQIDGPAVVMPEQTAPANGLILIGGKGVTQVDLIPSAIATAIGGNTMKVRVLVQLQLLQELADVSRRRLANLASGKDGDLHNASFPRLGFRPCECAR